MADMLHSADIKNPLNDFSFNDPFATWWPFILALLVGTITTIRGYLGGIPCPSNAAVHGKIVVITGGSRGIGLEVVLELINRGAKVIVAARNVEEATQRLMKALKTRKIIHTNQLFVQHLDLSSLDSVRKFALELETDKVDILINNGGVAFQPQQLTDEGLETHLVTNYLSHFLLTHLLLPKLQASDDIARVISVSSKVHVVAGIFLNDLNLVENYNNNEAYGQSKLALVLMTRTMAEMYKETNVTFNAMHPGLVRGTNHVSSALKESMLMRIMTVPWTWLLMKTAEQGAQTIIYMAVEPELDRVTGKYFSDCAEIEPSETAQDRTLGRELYKASLILAKL